jgi:hypothetical protein
MHVDIAFRRSHLPDLCEHELIEVLWKRRGQIKQLLDSFIASENKTMKLPHTYSSVLNFIGKHPEYKKHIRTRVRRFRKSDEYWWVERVNEEEERRTKE